MDIREWVVSVDDHVIEPGHVWQDYVPAKHRERAPKQVTDDDGLSKWEYEGRRTSITSLASVAGTPKDSWNPAPLDFSNLAFDAYSDPAARVAAMDEDRVLASLVFPTYPRFCGQTFLEGQDKELSHACVQAYNDWMIDEWCATAPGRFIPLIIIPLWDPELAAAEVRRCAAKGAKSVTFSENPSKLGLPSIHDSDRHWDPLFAACADTGLPLSIHIGSSSTTPQTSPDAPLIVSLTLSAMSAQQTFIDWMWSGNFSRFPDLKLCLSESGIGWAPAALARIERDTDRQRWARTSDFEGNMLTGDMKSRGSVTAFGQTPDDFDPRAVMRDHVYFSMIADDVGWDALDAIGCDNVLIETDYPHSDSSYPNSAALAMENLGHLDEDDRSKIMRDNACRVYNFTPAPVPAPTGQSA